jgi:hypothetical protein
MDLSVQELEAAINWWRDRCPARGSDVALSPEVKVLATVYALMIFRRTAQVALDAIDPGARQLILNWRAQHSTDTTPHA